MGFENNKNYMLSIFCLLLIFHQATIIGPFIQNVIQQLIFSKRHCHSFKIPSQQTDAELEELITEKFSSFAKMG